MTAGEVLVCSACLSEACWNGTLMCDQARTAGVTAVPEDAALSGQAWRDAAKKERSRQAAEGRRRAHRYVPRAAKGAGAQFKPGMARRMPGGGTDDAA
ncbi:MAG TPA: hypothetical protein VIX15_17405 [Streptosporangiaceae bacterium]